MTAAPNALASTLRAFFGDHLPTIRGVSPHTIRSYRDSLILLLRFIAITTGRPVAALDVPDLTVQHILAFLHHLEQQRHVTASTRNVRLAAIHAFARFLAAQEPTHLDQAQRLLAIPFKRARPRPISYLEYEEIAALLAGMDRSTHVGRRDYTLVATMFNTGARVQEILDLRASDLQITKPYQLRLVGKGRKVRWCPLWSQTAQLRGPGASNGGWTSAPMPQCSSISGGCHSPASVSVSSLPSTSDRLLSTSPGWRPRNCTPTACGTAPRSIS
jgi:site-specific recombinase XerD